MIRTVVTCDATACMALYIPPVDCGADVLERAARSLGWKRRTATAHACPSCLTGTGPVLELGECPTCAGRTVDLAEGAVCHYCGTVTEHPAEDDL
ncbi:hypothetical protein ACF1FX_34470 [Streptomyces sp. NPDC014646]|uniref:hypothetical protein n=1 Tax=Streptomyces sp. NPDC014646 TaxID=3364877 RepID=UPI0036F86A2B